MQKNLLSSSIMCGVLLIVLTACAAPPPVARPSSTAIPATTPTPVATATFTNTVLERADHSWEGILVEAPTLYKKDGKYYLFYSANAYNDRRYAVGYAVADKIDGPYVKPSDKPLLATRIPAGIVGPGGQDLVIDDDGELWLLFHAWAPAGYRNLNAVKVIWNNGVPGVNVTREPQPVP